MFSERWELEWYWEFWRVTNFATLLSGVFGDGRDGGHGEIAFYQSHQ